MKDLRGSGWAIGVAAVTIMATLALAPGAGAVPVLGDGDYFGIVGLGPPVNRWDPAVENASCAVDDSDAYSPAADGQIFTPSEVRDDAWDGLFNLQLGGSGYAPETSTDGEAILDYRETGFGGQATSKKQTLDGLRVSTITAARARASSTERVLVKLDNPNKAKRATDVIVDTNLGSDAETTIERTSSGDEALTKGDRWVVSSDNGDADHDPVATQVVFGKGKVLKPAEVINDLTDPPLECFSERFHVSVPGRATRYLLLFAEMNVNATKAAKSAKKFNDRTPSALLRGLSGKLRNRVLNWDL